MNYTKLSAEFSVAAQIDPADIEFFAREGFTTVICNRPDGEAAGQPSSASIREACEQHGIDFHMIAMQGRNVSPEMARQFHAVVDRAPGPVLGYCRSGMRSAILWEIATEGHLPL